jgi:hypothetical protein
MTDLRLARIAMAASLLVAPLAGVVAAVAAPALRTSTSAEIAAIAAHQDRFYVYAIAILISSYLLVPAFLGIVTLLRGRAPLWASAAAGLTLAGVLIAVGDAATELVYWQMGAPGADRQAMVALAERYQNAPGATLVYTVGGVSTLVGLAAVSVAIWRTRVVPRWAAPALLLGGVAQVVGFSVASQALLAGSYVVLLAAFVPVARTLITDVRPEARQDVSLERAGRR